MKMKRRIIKEKSFSDDDEWLIKQALERAIKAKSLLDEAAETIRDAVGETFLFARLDSHSMDLDDTIDEIKGVLNGTVDSTDDTVDGTDDLEHPFIESGKRFVKESEEGSEWFSSNMGEMVKPLPMDCIVSVSEAHGDVSGLLDDWLESPELAGFAD